MDQGGSLGESGRFPPASESTRLAADILRAVDGPSTRLRFRVSPGSSHTGIVGRHGDAWKVRVAAPPEDGKANEEVLELLARTLEVPRRSVTLATGGAARDKVVILEGLASTEVESKLAAAARSAR